MDKNSYPLTGEEWRELFFEKLWRQIQYKMKKQPIEKKDEKPAEK